MLQIVGTCAEVQRETVEATENHPAFESITYVMRSADGNTRYVRKGRAFVGPEPEAGQHLTLGVHAGGYKKRDGTVAVQLTAHTHFSAHTSTLVDA